MSAVSNPGPNSPGGSNSARAIEGEREPPAARLPSATAGSTKPGLVMKPIRLPQPPTPAAGSGKGKGRELDAGKAAATGFEDNCEFIGLGLSEDEAEDSVQQATSRGKKRRYNEGPGAQPVPPRSAKATPWFDGLNWEGKSVQEMLTAEIASFIHFIRPKQEEHQLRSLVIESVRRAISSAFPDAEVHPFGSYATQLYLPGGDIDLVVLSPSMAKRNKADVLYQLRPILQRKGLAEDVVVIARAKVPIIKFKTPAGGFNVDISINQANGLQAMKKVRQVLDQFAQHEGGDDERNRQEGRRNRDGRRRRERSRDRGKSDDRYRERDRDGHNSRHPDDRDRRRRAEREDGRGRGSDSPSHKDYRHNDRRRHHESESGFDKEHDGRDRPLSTEEEAMRSVRELGAARSLIFVIKSLLKQRGMNEVYTGGLGSYSVICLVVSFLQLHPMIQRGEIDPCENLGVLLIEFFELYGKHFNYDDVGISLRDGGYYFAKARRGWENPGRPFLLSIEDPADPTNDISGGSHNILGVRAALAGAFDLITNTLFHRHSILRARASNGRLKPLPPIPIPGSGSGQTATDPLQDSMLGDIMGVTEDVLNARAENLALFAEGSVQRSLGLPEGEGLSAATSLYLDRWEQASGKQEAQEQAQKDALKAEKRARKRETRKKNKAMKAAESDGPEQKERKAKERRTVNQSTRGQSLSNGSDARRAPDSSSRTEEISVLTQPNRPSPRHGREDGELSDDEDCDDTLAHGLPSDQFESRYDATPAPAHSRRRVDLLDLGERHYVIDDDDDDDDNNSVVLLDAAPDAEQGGRRASPPQRKPVTAEARRAMWLNKRAIPRPQSPARTDEPDNQPKGEA